MAGLPQPELHETIARPKEPARHGAAEVWDGRARHYMPGPKLRISKDLKLQTEAAPSLHPVTFEVIRNALWIVNQEQADTIRRVSSSPVTTFAFDFNTSIQNEVGDGVVFAPYLQYFPGMADLVVRWTLENLSEFPGIHDGDLFIQNDPLIGVSHQMDFQAFAPVFVGDELFCWIFNSIHVRDIGGVAPGSFCVDARDIYSEATPIPPLKIVERGRIRPDIEAALMRHSRMPGLLALDLRSQMAGIHASRMRILDLVKRYGAATVKAAMRKIISDTSRAVGERLSRLPDGTWRDVNFLGGMYTGDRGAYRVVLSMEKKGDQLTFSNAGTDPQVGSSNCSYAAWRAAILSSLCSMLAWDHRFCFAGVLEHMKFEGVPGTITCIDRNGAVSNLQGIMNTIFQAAKVASKMMVGDAELRKMAMTASVGTTFAGMSGLDQWGKPYASITLDVIAMGMPAFSFKDGIDQGSAHTMPSAESGDCEAWEQAYPIMYLFRRSFPGFGHGKYRGGSGLVMGWVGQGTEQQVFSNVSAPVSLPGCHGLWGGHWGQSGLCHYKSATDIREQFARGIVPATARDMNSRWHLEPVPPKTANIRMLASDVMVQSISAGGGYGDPIKRDPEMVLKDVAMGAVSGDIASRIYGVIINDKAVDSAATANRRQEIRRERISIGAPPSHPLPAQPTPNGTPLTDLYDVAEELKLVAIGADRYIVCKDCGHFICAMSENYKLGAARIDTSLTAIDAELFPDPATEFDCPIVYHEYLCPNCGVLLENELVRGDEPPVWDVQLAP
jgi:N-methylhydantoinase B